MLEHGDECSCEGKRRVRSEVDLVGVCWGRASL